MYSYLGESFTGPLAGSRSLNLSGTNHWYKGGRSSGRSGELANGRHMGMSYSPLNQHTDVEHPPFVAHFPNGKPWAFHIYVNVCPSVKPMIFHMSRGASVEPPVLLILGFRPSKNIMRLKWSHSSGGLNFMATPLKISRGFKAQNWPPQWTFDYSCIFFWFLGLVRRL